MKTMLRKKRWSPVLVGTGIGLLNVVTFYLLNQTIGTSSAFEQLGVYLYSLFAPAYLASSEYPYMQTPVINWYVAFVVGIFFGAWISAKLSGYTPQAIPSVWQANFGPSKTIRALGAFVGGFVLMFGARIARGCTSGHAISGGMQLHTAGWMFMIALFVSGIVTAHLLYKKDR